jgi:3-deoxy-7-phosphoheptulonate synthase
MIIVLRPHVTEEDLARVVDQVRSLGLTPQFEAQVRERTIVGCIGDEDRLREVPLMSFPAVESVLPIERPTSWRPGSSPRATRSSSWGRRPSATGPCM